MPLDYHSLESLRVKYPAWRLLTSQHAALIVSFLYRVLVARYLRGIAQADLVEALEDELFALRERLGDDSFPRTAVDYLNDWSDPNKGRLRKFYPLDSDEAQYDPTPATEKAIVWLESLGERGFVGTESRLLMLFDLLRELHQRRAQIDAQIAEVAAGNITLLDDTA